jgi:virginiamycin B lyase
MGVDRIGRITVSGEVTEYTLPSAGGFPAMITAATVAPDEAKDLPHAPSAASRASTSEAAMWFTLNQGNAIGRIDLGGAVTTYPLPTEKAGPVGISAGGEAAWFAEILAGQIGRIDAGGKIEEFRCLIGPPSRTRWPRYPTVAAG